MSQSVQPVVNSTGASAAGAARPQLRGFAWVVRRALFGIVLLMAFVAGGAWLLHASIDPNAVEVGASDKSE